MRCSPSSTTCSTTRRSKRGASTVEQVDFDLRSICEDVRALLQPTAAERGLALTMEYDESVPRVVKGDPVRLRQVLLNLSANAVKFTERGAVRVCVQPAGAGRVRVSVIDSGIGIASAQLEKLFERFTQADSSITRRYGGTGLGLAISRSLVELMGGEIGASSEIGQGSTFWFVLPLPAGSRAVAKTVATTDAHEAGRAAASAGSAPLAGRGRLLLVEDNLVNQRVALHMLAKMGYQVELAQNGVEAVEKLASARYDLVLMDCQMPEMDGFEATRIIRDPASRVLDHAVPVIAMTANAFAEDRERCLAAGMDEFLAKPVDRQTLAAMLSRWIAPPGDQTSAAAG